MDELLSITSASVSRFLRRWYGVVDGAGGPQPATSPHVPGELIMWHKAADCVGRPVTFQDRPIALSNLAPDSSGMLEFWVENQNGYSWAVCLADGRRRVFSREGGRVDWVETEEALGDFLLHCTVREALIGSASKFTVFVDSSELDEALESFERLKFVALDSEEPQVELWCSDNALVRMAPPPMGYSTPGQQLLMLTFATPSDSQIERYASRFNLDMQPEPAHSEPLYEPPPF
ncbi:hypothetical protein [Streptomyces virginiae]|uniref:hypothetical protein n=1 Tax=Streptomyces virginiae TaxID=1961 RepID=UPI00345D8690